MSHHHPTHAPWAISAAVEIDRHNPGFCGAFFRASRERRHVTAAYLSSRTPADAGLVEAAEFLRKADHRSILQAAYGTVPDGIRGALGRAGAAVHEERFYRVLHRLLAQPKHVEIGKCISTSTTLDLSTLRIIHLLPQAICRASVVAAIDDVQMGRDVATAFRLLCERGVREEELAFAVRQVRSGRDMKNVWRTWMLKASAPASPVPPSQSYRPVGSGVELHAMARRYRNCVRHYTIDLLDQEAGQAFAEVGHGGEGAVVHLARTNDAWGLEGIFGPGNAPPGEELRERVETYLTSHGVEIQPMKRRKHTQWDALRRLSRSPFFDYELD